MYMTHLQKKSEIPRGEFFFIVGYQIGHRFKQCKWPIYFFCKWAIYIFKIFDQFGTIK